MEFLELSIAETIWAAAIIAVPVLLIGYVAIGFFATRNKK